MTRLVNGVPLDDLLAIIRGRGDDPSKNVVDVPGDLGLRNKFEVPGNWGQAATIKYATTAADKARGIVEQAQLIDIGGAGRRPSVLTLDVGPAADPSGVASYPAGADTNGNSLTYRPVGLLRYGSQYGPVGFGSSEIRFDLGRGVRLVLPGNVIYLNAIMLPPPTGYLSGSMSIGASLGLYNGSTQAPPTLTEYVDNLAASAVTPAILIPAKANYLLPVLCSQLTGSYQLTWQDAASATIGLSSFSASVQNYPIPIPNDCVKVLLTNTGSFTTNFRLPFQLSL